MLYDPRKKLSKGVYFVEASAGTGKTYQITNIIVQLVATDNISIDEILVMTFTRAATMELRARIWGRLLDSITELTNIREGVASSKKDEFFNALAESSDSLDTMIERLTHAKNSFDTAQIYTIHGFCSSVLKRNAVEANVDIDSELISECNEYINRLVDDWMADVYKDLPVEYIKGTLKNLHLSKANLTILARRALDINNLKHVNPDVLDEKKIDAVLLKKAWNEEGKKKLLETAKNEPSFSGSSTFGIKKDNKPSVHFEKRLEMIDHALDCYENKNAVNASQLNTLYNEFCDKWPNLDLDDHPILKDILELRNDLRKDFIKYIRSKTSSLLKKLNKHTYNDLLKDVSNAVLKDDNSSVILALSKQYRAVLIDEFQDTDDLQWHIFEKIYINEPPQHWLFLIGDPKQSIYKFRGADVYVYLKAKESAKIPDTLDENYRSDKRLVDAMNILFSNRDNMFEENRLTCNRLLSPASMPLNSLSNDAVPPIEIRFVIDSPTHSSNAPHGPIDDFKPLLFPNITLANAATINALVSDIDDFLHSKLRIKTSGDAPNSSRSVHPDDIAVLVRANKEAVAVQNALALRGIPSTIAKSDSVFASDAANTIILLLGAIIDNHNLGLLRKLACTPIGPFDLPTLLSLNSSDDNPAWIRWLETVRGWRLDILKRGLTSVFDDILYHPNTLQKLASMSDGERQLTNFRHLIEYIDQNLGATKKHPYLLFHWLCEMQKDSNIEEAELKLESDKKVIKIMTLHTSKGLQFPFVFIPFSWNHSSKIKSNSIVSYHKNDELFYDLSQNLSSDVIDIAMFEELQEEMRLFYVGVTRAKFALKLYWTQLRKVSTEGSAPRRNALSPLGRLLVSDPDSDADGATHAESAERFFQAIDGLKPKGKKGKYADVEDLPTVESSPEHGFPKFIQVLNDLAAKKPDGATVTENGGSKSDNSAERHYIEWSFSSAPPIGIEPTETTDVALVPEAHTRRIYSGAPVTTILGKYSYSRLVRNANNNVRITGDDTMEMLEDESELQAENEESNFAITSDKECDALPEIRLAHFPAGKGPGSYVHKIFEKIDFCDMSGGEREAQIAENAEELSYRYGIDGASAKDLAKAMTPILESPILEGGLTLSQVRREKRLNELEFHLKLAGGTSEGYGMRGSSGRQTQGRQLAEIIADSGSGNIPDDYKCLLRASEFYLPVMRGFMVGAIDLVFEDGGKWYVCDYKTNLLRYYSSAYQCWRTTSVQYQKSNLINAMAHHHYYIQYHIYTLALHRYLKERLKDYNYEKDFGGVLYMFVRGMGEEIQGDSTPGVFYDRVPFETIERLDSALNGEIP